MVFSTDDLAVIVTHRRLRSTRRTFCRWPCCQNTVYIQTMISGCPWFHLHSRQRSSYCAKATQYFLQNNMPNFIRSQE